VRRASFIFSGILLCSCGPTTRAAIVPNRLTEIGALRLVGEYDIPSLTRFPPGNGPRFGGISGLATIGGGHELVGVSDDNTDVRVYRFEVREEPPFTVSPLDVTYLARDPRAPARLDAEGVAILRDGNLLIASEGSGSREPRIPPALVEYTRNGRFVRQLEVRNRYLPTPTGPLTHGARPNAAFESLAVVPGGGRLFTALESPLVQDGEPATFDHGAPVRILEYVRRNGTYEPAREFVYLLEPIVREDYAPDTSINGLVELIATSKTDLLALERSYVAEKDQKEKGANRIRLFRTTLSGASDVSGLESLTNASITPVKKTLLLDLSQVTGLSPALAHLENFEAMAFGPRLHDGRRSLILASDDNFSPTQRTSFLLFGVDR